MTGYFSRLAQRTGLGFAAGGARRASHASARSPEFAREKASAPAPLHAEEVTFVSQPQGDAPEAPTQSAGEGFRDAMRGREDESVNSRRDDGRFGDSTTDAAARSSTASATDEREPETPRRRADSDKHLRSFQEETDIRVASSAPQRRTSREPESYEPTDDPSESPRRTDNVEALPTATDAARVREPQRREAMREPLEDFTSQLDAEATGGMSRAEVYQNYLREVRKWVAEDVAATLDDESLKEHSSVASAARAEDALGYVRERETGAQDFNLSIGTISIVVEETPPQTVMQTTPPARAERTPAPRAARSSGRNYLRFK